MNYLGKKSTFTPERLVAIMLGDLKLIAEHDHGRAIPRTYSVPVCPYTLTALI